MKPDARNVASGRPPSVEQSRYGALADGRVVRGFALRNGGVELEAIEYGAIITSLRTPDHRGRLGDVVLGFDTLEGYTGDHPYFGALNMYQWGVFLGYHDLRHAAQIREIARPSPGS